ncbi:hypothetical protein DQQ10_01690 [Pseudochryseolinea flava]|uniref:Uncharacterized protein n=1 Tax=Pseudochryseolinea flava TaxID=2059302 RepID=A0A364Y6W4_9BACT|nr:hypothetical protein DQQ10_01690 [Pseudochryseolinea flava]
MYAYAANEFFWQSNVSAMRKAIAFQEDDKINLECECLLMRVGSFKKKKPRAITQGFYSLRIEFLSII